jgi:hypothetical protein
MTKQTRSIFVIMPFEHSPSRNKDELDQFFEYWLKKPLESSDDFQSRYRVQRSADAFNITDQIIHDLHNADIVICDLSGEHANPNVMYELGVRLALTHKPVIMIREQHNANKKIFDVSTYYTHPYCPRSGLKDLETHIHNKIKSLEANRNAFRSPVLATLARNPAVIAEIEKRRVTSQLRGLFKAMNSMLRAAGGSLFTHLTDLGATPPPPEKVSELLVYLVKNKEMLAKLDWTKFKFRPAPPPQLNALLSDNRLESTCEEWVAELWTELLSEYYGVFFGTDLFWSDTDYISMVSFVGDTHHVFAGVGGLIALIEADADDERKSALCEMLQPLVRVGGLPDHLRSQILDVVAAECGGP